MSDSESILTENKYLFTFQDETQLWISGEFIEKYPQLPFHDIIQHSEQFKDGSYYINMLPFHIEKVISLFNDKNIDISSLNLRDSYDIYRTLHEYSVTLDKKTQKCLLLHIKKLFAEYLKENNYEIFIGYDNRNLLDDDYPIELFDSDWKKISLFTQQRREEFFYYSLLIKLMNIIIVEIEYDYASDIPLEYICPLCIKDIFPSLNELTINVATSSKQTELILNPNSEEYIMEYARLYYSDDYEISKRKKNEYYTESEMNDYNKISSLDTKNIYYSRDLIVSYNKKKKQNKLPKIFKNSINEVIYTNDYSEIKNSEMICNNMLKDTVRITFDNHKNNKKLCIDKVSSEWGMSQLLQLCPYFSISEIWFNTLHSYSKYEAMIIIKSLEGVFDSLKTLNIRWIKELFDKINNKLFIKIMTTHVFPNVTEIIYDDATSNFEFLFPMDLMSIIDTIRINRIDINNNKEIATLLDNLVYSHSIHIDEINPLLCIDTSDSINVKKLDYFEKYKHNIDRLDITFNDNMEDDIRNSLEGFLKSSVLEHLNELNISFEENISLEYLKWISSAFNDNKIKVIKKLTINLRYIKEDSFSEYFTILENIMNILIPIASIVFIYGNMADINRLILKGCFHNITEFSLYPDDIPDEHFCELYTTDSFPKLKLIKFRTFRDNDWWNGFIQKLCTYMNHNNFPLSTSIQLIGGSSYTYIYDPNTSILRCKQDTHSLMDTIKCTEDKTINEYEIETLFDCINENKTKSLKSLEIYEYIPDEHINSYKQQLIDSMFIQENHVYYKFD
ncbi:hypothetical protein WA158_004234 [Blastocystis sp. Blastoise]